jgi:hypothetical protein
VSILKGYRKFGMPLLGIWLVVTGLRLLIHLDFLLMDKLLAGLAIAAGALILLDR